MAARVCVVVALVLVALCVPSASATRARAIPGMKKSPQDLLSSLGSLLGGVGNNNKHCKHTCPSGSPKARAGHTPSSNGCGSQGVQVTPHASLTSCCDEHDRCYDTCGQSKVDCDDVFARCLTAKCTELPEHERPGCDGQGQLLSAGVTAFGCRSYLESQRNACVCEHDHGDL